MKSYTYLKTFAEVARRGSFIAAASALDLPRSTVSQHVQKLEAELGTRLIKRSTRALSLTAAGQRLFADSDASLATLERALRQAEAGTDLLHGKITLSAPADFDPSAISSAMKAFRQSHPGVEFDIRLSNDAVNLIEDGVDIALGITSRSDGGRVEKQVLAVDWCLCASPEFLATVGHPDSVETMAGFISPRRSLQELLERKLTGGRKLPTGSIRCDNLAMIRALVMDGIGVGLLPTGMVSEALESGTLVTLLPEALKGQTELVVVFPSPKDIAPHVRAFYTHLAVVLSAPARVS